MRGLGIGLAGAALLLAGCGDREQERVRVPTDEGMATVTTEGDSESGTMTIEAPDGSRTVIGAGSAASAAAAPAFAQPYPGAQVEAAQIAERDGERGGILSFTTDAHPDTVIDFYRQRADEAGLSAGASLRQGESRVYQAEAEGVGASLMVVVTPVDDRASVQVTWSAGG